jgi:signal transduction histidine kinase/AmiR/NasT family two-component response regulator
MAMSTLQEEGNERAPPAAASKPKPDSPGSAIAIIDDLESNRTLLEYLARRLPGVGEVVTFASAGDALEAFAGGAPDLVITDFNMPGMNAVEFLKTFRKTPPLEDVPVIVVSSHSESENRNRALQAGATDFLMVPFDTFEFQARTRNLLRLSLHQKSLKTQSLSLEDELQATRYQSIQTQHRFTSIIDSIPALVFAVNQAGDCVFANHACYDFLGVLPDQGPRGTQLLAAKAALPEAGQQPDEDRAGREVALTGKDGRERVFFIVARPADHGSADDGLTVYTGIEISQLKDTESSLRRAKDQAEAANRAKSAFLSNMTHEIRTPLNAIIGFTDVMHNELYGPIDNEKYKDYLRDIKSSATHLLAIINEILDFSQIEAKRQTVKAMRFSLRACIAEIRNLTAHQVNANGNWVQIEQIPDLMLHSDPQKLSQVLLNMVTNANNAMRTGIIRISAARSASGGLTITVGDSGVGMDQEELAVALTEFGRGSISAFISAGSAGTGLGLPISVGLMKLLGGSLTIESEKNVGTSVHLSLPPSAIVEDIKAGMLCGVPQGRLPRIRNQPGGA